MKKILITGGNSQFAKDFYFSNSNKDLKFIFLDKTKPLYLTNKIKNFFFYKINISNIENLILNIRKILKKFTSIDYVISYASIRSKKKKFSQETLLNWNNTFRVNVTANFFLLKYIIENNVKKKKNCRIVNISSISSRLVTNESPSYQISKSALNHLTKYYASIFGKQGIFINNVLPGMIVQEKFYKKFFLKSNNRYRKIINKTHLTNKFGKVEDVNKLIEFLLFSENNFINGQSFLVDGGVSVEDPFSTSIREFLK